MGFNYYAHMNDTERCSMLVKLLAAENSVSIQDMLRNLGKQAVEKKDYPSFNMVAKLWKSSNV